MRTESATLSLEYKLMIDKTKDAAKDEIGRDIRPVYPVFSVRIKDAKAISYPLNASQ